MRRSGEVESISNQWKSFGSWQLFCQLIQASSRQPPIGKPKKGCWNKERVEDESRCRRLGKVSRHCSSHGAIFHFLYLIDCVKFLPIFTRAEESKRKISAKLIRTWFHFTRTIHHTDPPRMKFELNLTAKLDERSAFIGFPCRSQFSLSQPSETHQHRRRFTPLVRVFLSFVAFQTRAKMFFVLWRMENDLREKFPCTRVKERYQKYQNLRENQVQTRKKNQQFTRFAYTI